MIDTHFPLPFRITLLLNLGAWLWFLVLRALADNTRINIQLLLKLDHPTTQQAQLVESRATNVSIVAIFSYLLFHMLHDTESEAISLSDYLPLITLVWTIHQFITPKTSRLATSLKRVLQGRINRDIRTNEIILSDTLTSYSKVFVDWAVYLCHLFHGQTCLPKVTGSKLDRSCGEQIFLDSMVGSIPNFIRLSQCFREWKMTGDKTHMWNFLKYSSNIPVLITGLLIRHRGDSYLGAWVLFALFNSSYSFYWDINNDWNLGLFKKAKTHLLRPTLVYSENFYLLAIAFDLMGRFIWVAKFLPPPVEGSSSIFYIGLTSLFSTEDGWFALELIEILRRCVWVFIKLEVDYINLSSSKDVQMTNV